VIGRVALLLALAGAAQAAEPLTDDEAGKRHYMSAQAYFDQASYKDALREYQESYRLSKYPAILYQIGLCQERLGMAEQAIESFEKYLELDPQSRRRESVETTIRNLKARKVVVQSANPTATTPTTATTTTSTSTSSRWVAPGVVLGVGAACLVAGGALVGTVGGDYDTLDRDPMPGTPDYLGQVNALESRYNAGIAMLAIGGAALVIDAVLWSVAAKRREPRRFALSF
jgi:tetratricopeptide (TPR) repeat protein